MTTIYFDMDGTIADLYAVEGWLPMLRAYDATPYAKAAPLVNLSRLARILNRLQAEGYRIGIISWLSRESNEEYNEAVRRAKRCWLASHMPSVFWDEIHIVKYGTPKQLVGRDREGVLFDDEEHNRLAWKGEAFSPEEIFEVLNNF